MSKRNAIEDTAIGNMGSELHIGAVTLNDVGGEYYAMQCLTDVVPTVMGFGNSTGYNFTPGSFTIPAGTVIYGDLLYIVTTATDSAFILYKRV